MLIAYHLVRMEVNRRLMACRARVSRSASPWRAVWGERPLRAPLARFVRILPSSKLKNGKDQGGKQARLIWPHVDGFTSLNSVAQSKARAKSLANIGDTRQTQLS